MIGYYDLSRCPPTYDVVTFLIRLERERLARGHQVADIEIMPGPDGGFRRDNNWPEGVATRVMLRQNIVVPMCRMLPSVRSVVLRQNRDETPAADSFGFNQYSMQFKHFAPTYADGIRPLRPVCGDAPYDPELVTVTLRECGHWAARNSRFDEWLAAAREIAAAGYRVVIVRDTEKADEQAQGFKIAPDASRDLEARGRLYRSAFCNLFINNGPAWFALALDAPVVMLRPATEGVGACYGREWFQKCGIEPGRQMKGAPAHQRLVWEEDRVHAIVQAFDEFCAVNQRAAA